MSLLGSHPYESSIPLPERPWRKENPPMHTYGIQSNSQLENPSATISHNLPKPICPFISSTFQDFQNEREYLVKKTFPALEALCKERGSCFSPVDLRWGISNEQAQSGQVIRLCLDYIEQSEPFFICLLGERYGQHRDPNAPSLPSSSVDLRPDVNWLDRSFLIAAENGHPWVLDQNHSKCSVTELEVIKASFREKYIHCHFYIRNRDHINDLIKDLPFEQQEQLSKVYQSESSYALDQMNDLKEELARLGQLGIYSVKSFQTPEELGKLVLQDWTEVIHQVLPEEGINRGGLDAGQYQELILQETFADRRRRVYMTTPEAESLQTSLFLFISPLWKFGLESSDLETAGTICVVSGAPGSGKTSLVVNWVDQLQIRGINIPVFSLYVGSTPGSTDIAAFFQRCIAKIADICNQRGCPFPDGLLGKGDKDDETSFHTVCSTFYEAVKYCPSIIIIDGVDRLGQALECSAEQVKELAWLPMECNNAAYRFIVSTSPESLIIETLRKKEQVQFLEVPCLHGRENRTAIIQRNLKLHNKTLSSKQLAFIAASPLSNRPVFQTILANELRVFGSYEQLDNQVQSYASVGSIPELWQKIIHRWCREYGWTQQKQKADTEGWVAESLKLLVASLYGLTSAEILAILSSLGYQGAAQVTSMDWALFQSAAGEALCQQLGGLVTFSYQDLRETVAEMFSDQETQKLEYHRSIATYLITQPKSGGRTEELLWQLEQCSMWEKLRDTLASPLVFCELYDLKRDHSKRLHLLHYWHCLRETKTCEPGEVYLEMLLHAAAVLLPDNCPLKELKTNQIDISHGKQTKLNMRKVDCNEYTNLRGYNGSNGSSTFAKLALAVGQFLAETSYFADAQHALCWAIEALQHTKPGRTHEDKLLVCEAEQALADLDYYQLKKGSALTWYTQALASVDILMSDEKQDKQRKQLILLKGEILDRLANIQTFDFNYSEAAALLQQAQECMELAKSTPGFSRVAHHLGILQFRERCYHDAYKSLQDALQARIKWFGRFHPKVAEVEMEMADQLADRRNPLFHFQNSLNAYDVALQIRQDHLGSDHLLVATILFHKAKLLLSEGTRRDEAMKMLNQALKIRIEKLGSDHEITHAVRRVIEREGRGQGKYNINVRTPTSQSHQTKPVVPHPSDTSTWWRGQDNRSSGGKSFKSLDKRNKRVDAHWLRITGGFGQRFGYLLNIDNYYRHVEDFQLSVNDPKGTKTVCETSRKSDPPEQPPPVCSEISIDQSACSPSDSAAIKWDNPFDAQADGECVFSWSHQDENIWELSERVLDVL